MKVPPKPVNPNAYYGQTATTDQRKSNETTMDTRLANSGWRRFIRFILAGGVNTLFGLAVYSVAITFSAPVWGALLLANATGVAFNFVTTGGFVFRNMLLSRFPCFLATYLAIYLINWTLIAWLTTWVPNPIYAQAVLTVPIAILSYHMLNRYVFNKI